MVTTPLKSSAASPVIRTSDAVGLLLLPGSMDLVVVPAFGVFGGLHGQRVQFGDEFLEAARRCRARASRDIRAAIRDYQQRRWRNAAAATLMARNMGAIGQWNRHTVCTARNTLIRSIPLSLQLRQFDLVLGAPRQAS